MNIATTNQIATSNYNTIHTYRTLFAEVSSVNKLCGKELSDEIAGDKILSDKIWSSWHWWRLALRCVVIIMR